MKIRWWRISALSLITLTALFGAVLAFSKPQPPSEKSVTKLLPASRGPGIGDLQDLITSTPLPTVAPIQAVEAPATAPKRTTTTARSAPKATGNPFKKLPGGGILKDLCNTGRC